MSEDVFGKGFIYASRFVFKQSGLNGDACGTKLRKALARHFGIGISHGRDHARNAGGDQRVSTWRRATLMAVWFKIEIDCAAARFFVSLLQREDFSVLDAVVSVEAVAGDLALAIDNDRANARTGRGERCALAGKVKRLAHVVFVLWGKIHFRHDSCANELEENSQNPHG